MGYAAETEWKFEKSGLDGACLLFGVNIFEYEWKSTGEVACFGNPCYGNLRRFHVYEAIINGACRRFAARRTVERRVGILSERGRRTMKYYLAPMEGITGYIYRKTYHSLFPSFDKYMTPFLAPKQGKKLSGRDKGEILPENNQGMEVIPQILTNQAEDFVRTARELAGYGYKEVNLNLGCPSGTVVSKKKGAGLLGEPEMLKRLLEGIFDALNAKAAAGTTIEISIKTRLGMEDAEEFGPLLEIYHDYPLKELSCSSACPGGLLCQPPELGCLCHGAETVVLPGDL